MRFRLFGNNYFLIKNYSRKFNLDLNYFIKGSTYSVIQQTIGIICGLTVSYFYGHGFSKVVFGEFNLVLAILTIVFPFCLPGIDSALTRSVGLGYDKSLITGTKAKFRYSLLGFPVLLGFAIYYFTKQHYSLAEALVISAVLFPILNCFTSYPSFLTAKKMFRMHAVSAIFSSIFFLFMTAISAYLFPSTLGLTLGYLLALIIPAIINYIIILRYVDPESSADPELIKYGKFLTTVSVLPWISGGIGNIILANFLGSRSLATYSVAERFLLTAQKNFQAFYKPASAKLSSQSSKQHLDTVKKHWIKMLLLGFLIFILMWFSAPFLINIFFSTTYSDAVIYARLLSVGLVVMPISWVLGDIIVFQKKLVSQLLSSLIVPVIKIFLYLILIPKFHIYGLVYVFLIDRFISPLIPLSAVLISSRKKR